MSWTTPADFRAQVQKHWDNGRLLRDAVGASGGSHELETDRLSFPLTLRLRGPTPRELATRHDEVRAWIRELEAASRAALGCGYDIVWSETSNRVIGRNRIPGSIIVPTRTDALALIGQAETAERFNFVEQCRLRSITEGTTANWGLLRMPAFLMVLTATRLNFLVPKASYTSEKEPLPNNRFTL